MKEEFSEVIRQQKDDIEKMHENMIRLEARVDANERLVRDISSKLTEIRTLNTKTYWLTIFVIIGIILLLGT